MQAVSFAIAQKKPARIAGGLNPSVKITQFIKMSKEPKPRRTGYGAIVKGEIARSESGEELAAFKDSGDPESSLEADVLIVPPSVPLKFDRRGGTKFPRQGRRNHRPRGGHYPD